MEGVSSAQLREHITYLETLLRANNIPFTSLDRTPGEAKTSTKESLTAIGGGVSLAPLQTNLRPDILPRHLIQRYSRQMLLKEIGFAGQAKLRAAKIAIIGCGGIGCPLAMYLAAAGVGTLGLFDGDRVELTNLHRQIGHREASIGQEKSQSLKQTILQSNPYVQVATHPFVEVGSLSNIDKYDLVLDGSDNAKCRYLVNDYCQRIKKPLLSGACIGWEGQITAYGLGAACYRCLWGNDEVSAGGCSTRGVVGMLPGIVAMIVAVEAMKLVVLGRTDLQGTMVLYDGISCSFRKIKLRHKRQDCIACGTNPMKIEQYNYSKYEGTCAQPPPDVKTVTWQSFIETKGLLVDVRSEAMFNIARFEPSVNVPYDRLRELTRQEIQKMLEEHPSKQVPQKLYVSCRRGNDSRRAVDYLLRLGFQAHNVQGGIEEYGRLYDSNVPHL